MRMLRGQELDAVSGGDLESGDYELGGKKPPSKPPTKPDGSLDTVWVRATRMLRSSRVRILGFIGVSTAVNVTVREAVDNNGDVLEEVLVVADKIDDSDVPPASVLFGAASDVSPSERMEYWQQALKNMSPEELRLIAQDLDALKMKSEVTAALDAIITQVQASLRAAADLPPAERAKFASSIAQNIGFNTTLINWGGLGCWWGPR